MGFWNGRVTFTRYRVAEPFPSSEEALELARQHLFGIHRAADPTEGVSTGWSGGDHVLDLTLEPEKNVVGEALHLAIRIDADKIPATLLRAYTQIEIEARARLNPNGIATKGQKQEAKEAARLRVLAEAEDGRFRRLTHHPILWDAASGIIYAGSNSAPVLERVQALFRETFDRTLEPITAGSLARDLAVGDASNPLLSDEKLSSLLTLVGGAADLPSSVAWAGDDLTSLDHLGNEFLVWIWHRVQNGGETVKLSDGSEVAVMLRKTLLLDCPRGETGRDQLTDDAPARLPEALRALQAGKLPRKAGMILSREGAEYELLLQAETLAVSGAGLPRPEEGRLSPYETRLARLESLRHLTSTLDLLFAAYLLHRTSSNWSEELGRIRNWLQAA